MALLVFGLFAAVGCWRGALASGLAVAGLAIAYGTALLSATLLGPLAAERLGWPLWLAAPLMGTASASLAYILFAAYGSSLRRNERERLGESGRRAADRLFGGFFGACRGGLVVLLLSYLAVWLDASQAMAKFRADPPSAAGQQPPSESLTSDSVAAKLAGNLVENAVGAAAGNGPGSRVMARFAARPGLALLSVQNLSDNEALRAVQGDRFFWTLVKSGAVDRAANQLSFQALIHDESVRREFANLGLVSPTSPLTAKAFRDELTPILGKIGPRLKALEDDPEVLSLAEDPEVIGMLQSGDTLALMGHPKVRHIASRFSEGL